MMTRNNVKIFEALTWADDTLKATLSTAQNPKVDAQVLLAFVVGKGTAYLFAHGDDVLTDAREEQFRRLVERRTNHEPVAYLLGNKEFYGRTFAVTHDVLIPRPDTETLVDTVISLISHDLSSSLIIDVGTGSGAIAVTLACETGRTVVAIDESAAALDVAARNAQKNGCADRVAFLHGNLLTPLMTESNGESLGEHVVIAANLPYIAQRQYNALDPDVKNFEPVRALVSGANGLDHYDALFTQLALRRNAFPKKLDVVIEIDPSQKLSAPGVVHKHFPHASTTVINDLAGKPRVVHVTL